MSALNASFLVTLSLVLWGGLLLRAADRPVFDFAEKGGSMGIRFHEFAQTGRVTEFDGRPAFELSWDGGRKPYCEVNLRQKPVLPAFREAVLSVTVFVPEDTNATHVTVRLQDREDEVFQLRQGLPGGARGWHRLSFPLRMENAPAVSWGGKNPNKRFDPPLRFAGLTVGYPARDVLGTLGLGAASIDVIQGDISVSLVTGNPIHVLRPGEENRLSLSLANPASREASARLTCEISQVGDDFGVERFTRGVDVPADGEISVDIPAPKRFGVYSVQVSLEDERGEVLKRNLSYAYLPPASPAPGPARGFYFGISDHPQWYPAEEQELMALAAAWAGVKVIRDGIDWRRMEPSKGRWDFSSFDRFLEVFAKYDIELAPTFPGPVPEWATAADWKPVKQVKRGRPRPDYGHWTEFVRTFVGRYKGRIRFVETWNEPDLLAFANFTVEEYVKLMEIAYSETKKLAPEIFVQSGGFTAFKVSSASTSDPDYLEKAIRSGKDYYDIFAFHGHGSFPHFAPQIPKLVALRKELEDAAPWWANETAVSAVHVGEVGQAETLFQKLIFSWANGAIGYNWYNLRNKGFDPKNNEHNFGLLTKDFHPKPAYVTYNMLARHYGEARFVRALDLGPDAHGYLFRAKNGDHLLANWRAATSDGAVQPVVITGITGAASLIDIWGNEQTIRPMGGAVTLPVARRPLTLRIQGQATEPLVVGALFQTQEDVVVREGERAEVGMMLSNPTRGPLTFEFGARHLSGVEIEPASGFYTLNGGESRRVAFDLKVHAIEQLATEERLTLDVRVGELWAGTVEYRLRTARRIPTGGIGGVPLFFARDVSQVTSLVVNEPATAHLFWTGPEDLSARIWVAESAGVLRLQVEVVDDVHVQTNEGSEVWLGDSIQLGFLLPGQRESWEIGLTRLADGRSEVFVWNAPQGFDAATVAGAIHLTTRRDDEAKLTVYEAVIPRAAIDLSEDKLRRGFSFNLLVNDNDGNTREGFIAVAPGFGRNKAPAAWPVLIGR